MLERFTDKAKKVVILAKNKATERGDPEIGPVHMLYGLAVTDGVAARALAGLGVDAAAVERELGSGSSGALAADGVLPGGAAHGDAEALAAIGIDLDEIKRKVEESFGPGALERVPLARQGPLNWTGRLPMNDQAKLSLELSLKEARALHHNYLGTEHLLLGLLRAAERHPHGKFAAATLPDLGLDPATARERVLAEVTDMQRRYPPGQ
jgi:ATP-dependent Clp protease ATP-binding subunit ClpA